MQRECSFHRYPQEDEEEDFEFCSSCFETDDDPLSPTPLSAAASPYTEHHPAFDVAFRDQKPKLIGLVSSQKARAVAQLNPPHRRPPSLQLPQKLHAVKEQQEPNSDAADQAHLPFSPYAASHSTAGSAAASPKRITPPARRRWTLASLLGRKDHKPNYYSNSNSSNSSRSSMDGAPETNSKSPGRYPPSPYALHYAAQRAHDTNLRKRTSLPYKQNLLGCLGFASVSAGAYYSTASQKAYGQPISA